MSVLRLLPSVGALQLLIVSALVAMGGFSVSIGMAVRLKRWKHAAAAVAPLALAVVTTVCGARLPALHGAAALTTLGFAAGNAVVFRGAGRVAEVVGGAAWLVSLLAARSIFGWS